jgi:hypothetical protein
MAAMRGQYAKMPLSADRRRSTSGCQAAKVHKVPAIDINALGIDKSGPRPIAPMWRS